MTLTERGPTMRINTKSHLALKVAKTRAEPQGTMESSIENYSGVSTPDANGFGSPLGPFCFGALL